MSKEIIGKVHGIITQNRLAGAQYSFIIHQVHPERGGVVVTHNFSKTYLKAKYEKVVQETHRMGLPVQRFFTGKPNEYMQITHAIPMRPEKAAEVQKTRQ